MDRNELRERWLAALGRAGADRRLLAVCRRCCFERFMPEVLQLDDRRLGEGLRYLFKETENGGEVADLLRRVARARLFRPTTGDTAGAVAELDGWEMLSGPFVVEAREWQSVAPAEEWATAELGLREGLAPTGDEFRERLRELAEAACRVNGPRYGPARQYVLRAAGFVTRTLWDLAEGCEPRWRPAAEAVARGWYPAGVDADGVFVLLREPADV